MITEASHNYRNVAAQISGGKSKRSKVQGQHKLYKILSLKPKGGATGLVTESLHNIGFRSQHPN